MEIYVKTEDIQFCRNAKGIEYSLTNVREFVERCGVDSLAHNLEHLWLCRTPELAAECGAVAPFTAVQFH